MKKYFQLRICKDCDEQRMVNMRGYCKNCDTLFTRAEIERDTADLTVEATLQEDIELMPLGDVGQKTPIREYTEAALDKVSYLTNRIWDV